ncbi:MAG: ComEC/Rec2 family competence protein [Clostridia bacterium]
MESPAQPEVRIFNRRPMAVAALSLAAGIVLSPRIKSTWLIIAVCFFAFLLVLVLFESRHTLAIAIIMLSLGMLCAYASIMLPRPSPPVLSEFFYSIKDALCLRTDVLFGHNSGVLSGMLWGEKADISQAALDIFRDTGIAHVFALSGLHVSFFVGAFMLVLPKHKRWLRFILVFTFLLLYCSVCAFPASLVRASVMALCLLGSNLLGRPGDSLSSLCFAAIVILLCAPAQLAKAGFLMSFVAVAAIAMLGGGIKYALRPLGKVASATVSVSISASLGTLPLIAHYFQRIPLLSLPANLLILPALPVAVLCGFIAVILDFISPILSFLPALISNFLIDVVVRVSSLVANMPLCAIDVKDFPATACILYFLALLAISRYTLLRPLYKWSIFSFLLLLCLAVTVLL